MNPQSGSPTTEVRTFRATNTRAALAAIKQALGREAVILETREVSGAFGRSEIEVVAASGPGAEDRDGLYSDVPLSVETASSDELRAEVIRLREMLDEMKDVSTDVSAERRKGKAGWGGPWMNFVKPGSRKPMAPERAKAFERLVERGIEERIAEDTVNRAAGYGAGSDHGQIQEEVGYLLRKRMTVGPVPWRLRQASDPKGPRLLGLVGPTGVGKTTTIAKIAAHALLESRLKVGLITVDTYRLGAADQLAQYGKIMGVPTVIAKGEIRYDKPWMGFLTSGLF